MKDVDLSDVPPVLRAQIRRRIAAIERYLARTKRDRRMAQTLARRLGMTTARFERLANSWARHRRALLIADTRYRPRPIDPAVALILEAILGGGARLPYETIVDALIQAAKRRSIPSATYKTAIRQLTSASRKFASPAERKGTTAAEFAEQLCVAKHTFQKMASAWADSHRRTPKTRPAPARPHNREAVERLVEEVATDDTAELPLIEIMRHLAARCAALGLRAPSAMKVSRILAARKIETEGAEQHGINEDRVHAAWTKPYRGPTVLAVQHGRGRAESRDPDGTVAAPTIVFAILMPERYIVAHFLALSAPRIQASAQVVIKALAMATAGAPTRPISYPKDEGNDWAELDETLAGLGVITVAAGTEPIHLEAPLELMLEPGPRGYLPLRRHTTGSKPSTVLPLTKIAAAVRKAVAAHNLACGWGPSTGIPTYALVEKPHISSLRAKLAAIAKRMPDMPRTLPLQTGADPLGAQKARFIESSSDAEWPLPNQVSPKGGRLDTSAGCPPNATYCEKFPRSVKDVR